MKAYRRSARPGGRWVARVLECGHEFITDTTPPVDGDEVWCSTCRDYQLYLVAPSTVLRYGVLTHTDKGDTPWRSTP